MLSDSSPQWSQRLSISSWYMSLLKCTKLYHDWKILSVMASSVSYNYTHMTIHCIYFHVVPKVNSFIYFNGFIYAPSRWSTQERRSTIGSKISLVCRVCVSFMIVYGLWFLVWRHCYVDSYVEMWLMFIFVRHYVQLKSRSESLIFM